jgi:hypothetical protein
MIGHFGHPRLKQLFCRRVSAQLHMDRLAARFDIRCRSVSQRMSDDDDFCDLSCESINAFGT